MKTTPIQPRREDLIEALRGAIDDVPDIDREAAGRGLTELLEWAEDELDARADEAGGVRQAAMATARKMLEEWNELGLCSFGEIMLSYAAALAIARLLARTDRLASQALQLLDDDRLTDCRASYFFFLDYARQGDMRAALKTTRFSAMRQAGQSMIELAEAELRADGQGNH